MRASLGFALLFCVLSASSSVAPQFVAAPFYPAGLGANSIAAGDFNNDGHLDLVTGNDSKSVSVLLGNGDGTFQSPVTFVTPQIADGVAVGDLNSDGKQDIAVANFGGEVTVLLGNGDGTFQAAVNYPVDFFPEGIAVADLNGDGIPDLAVADCAGVRFLLGNGDGTFVSGQLVSEDGVHIQVAVVDVNNDGIQDLVTTDLGSTFGQGSVSVFLGIGNGMFQAEQVFHAGRNADRMALGDFNGDGFLDVAVGNINEVVTVLLNRGAAGGASLIRTNRK